MKFAALITVATLTCATAFAQGYGSTADRDTAAKRDQSVAVDKDAKPAGEGIVQKTKRAFQRLGDKIRSAGSKSKDADKTASEGDTRSMGAAGSGSADSERKARMDEAYANSRKAKPQDK